MTPHQVMLAQNIAAAGGADVAKDSQFELGASSQASPMAFASNAGTVTGTVTGANPNRFLLAYVGFFATGFTITAMTWNGVSMLPIIGTKITGGGGELHCFGLIAPAGGNNTLSATWTGGSNTVCMGAISLYNVNQTTATQNNSSDTGTGTSASSTVTSASGNCAIIAHMNNNATTTTIAAGTEAWIETALNGNYALAYRISTTTSTVLTYTLGSSVTWANFKVDVIKA